MVKINWCVFLIEDDDLLKKYNTVWHKVSSDIKKEFDIKPVYKKFLKTKIECYSDEATDFHNKEVSNLGCNYVCLAVISLDCALKKYQSYYLEVLLKEWN